MRRWLVTSLVVLFSALTIAPRSHAQAPPAAAAGEHWIIMGNLTIKAGQEPAFLKIVDDMTARVKREDKGNVRYDLFKVAPIGRRGGPPADGAPTGTRFVFIEEWENQAAFQAHSTWAGAIVQNQWRPLADNVELVRLTK